MNRKENAAKRGESGFTRRTRGNVTPRKKLNEDHIRYEEKLTTLHKHASQLGLANSIDEIAKYTLDAMEFALGFDFADVAMVEDKSLRVVGYRGHPSVLWEAPLADVRSVKVKAASTKKTVGVPDTRKEPAYVDGRGFDWTGPPTALSELAVPIMVDNETVAVLNVEWEQVNAFTSEDQSLLEILAFHVSSAFKRLKFDEKLMALHWHALQLSSATSTDQIIEHTLDAMEFGLGFDYANFNLVENRGILVRGARGKRNFANPDLSLDGPGIIVRAAIQKTPVRISDTRKEPAYVDPMGVDWIGPPTMLSELAAPVIIDGETAAVLNVESTQVDSFTADAQTLLETLAIHVASDLRRLRDLEALRRSEERFRGLLEHLPVGVYRSTPEGNFLEANQTLADIMGYQNVSQLQKIDIIDMYVQKTARAERVQKLRINGSNITEFELQRKDGRRIWVRDYSIATFDPAGNFVYSDGILTDITDRKHAETEIRKLSQFQESIIDNANVWLNVLDQNANVLTWNKAAEEISGYARGEVVGHAKIWEWLYPDEHYRRQVIARANEVIEKKLGEENVDTRITRKDGQIRIIAWNSRALFDENNRTVGSVALGRDITEQERMQKELQRYSKHLEELVEERTVSLRESEERLNTIIQASPEGIIVTDLKGNITDCNQAALQLYHSSSKDEMIGKNALELISNKDREMAYETFQGLSKKGTVKHMGYSFISKDGHDFPSEFSASVVKDAAGVAVAYVAVVKDLTEQIEVQDRLRRAERMAVIGETAAMVGHDLRNPLQGISGAAYVLRQKWGPSADVQTMEMLGLIDNGLDYADKIVKELLDYSREIRLELTETTVKAVIDSALFQMAIPENITIRNMIQDAPAMSIDIAKVQRVFVNLIGNAIDAMPKGGELTISSSDSDEILEVKFVDTGEGIPDNVMKNLWKPLQTTKSKGMGLGLAICKRIVEAHGGTIQVESVIGNGSTFTVRIPRKRKANTLIEA